MQIEAGKFYRTRDGQKVGPVYQRVGYFGADGFHYSVNGECCYFGKSGSDTVPNMDLVAEWVDEPQSPIREVTRTELVAGHYGHFLIEPRNNNSVLVGMEAFEDGLGVKKTMTAQELRDAARVFTEIADYLQQE